MQKNAFGQDSDQTSITCELRGETPEDLPARERVPDREPEEPNAGPCGGASKPQRKGKQRELLELCGKRPQSHVAPAFPFKGLIGEANPCVTSGVCRWQKPRRSEYARPTVPPSPGYYTL
jgi:hypothetical protein